MVFQAVLGSPDRADAMSPGLPACLSDGDKHPHVCETGIIQQPRDQLDRANPLDAVHENRVPWGPHRNA